MKFDLMQENMRKFKERALETENGIVIMGIDPGITGAFSLVLQVGQKGKAACVFDMPTSKIMKGSGGKRSKYDLVGIVSLLRPLLLANRKGKIEMHACMEKPSPNVGMQSRIAAAKKSGIPMKRFAGDTPQTAFSVGWSGGMWPLFLTSWNVKLHEVMPAEWKTRLKLNRKDKEASRQLAARQFPRLAANYLSAMSHHNRAEALLLTLFYYRFVFSGRN